MSSAGVDRILWMGRPSLASLFYWTCLVATAVATLLLPLSAVAKVEPGIDRDFSVIAKNDSTRVNGDGKTIIEDNLFRGKRKVGTSTTTCRSPGKVIRCRLVFRLPEGVIYGFGDAGKDSGPARILDGTRAYRNASGTVQGKLVRKETLLITFHIDK